MKQVLFVRPDSREGGKIMWCESGSERVEVVDSLEMLSEHPGYARLSPVTRQRHDFPPF